MLSSKQLLWHSGVVVGLKRLFSAQFPFPETDAMPSTNIAAHFLLHYLKLLFKVLPVFFQGLQE
jgi:hypothetical protein